MKSPRRNVLRKLFALGAMSPFGASPAFASVLDSQPQETAAADQEANPDFDAESFHFWSNFNKREATPVVVDNGQSRGNQSAGNGAAKSG